MAVCVGLFVWGFESLLPIGNKALQIVELLGGVIIGVAVFAVISLKLKMPEAELVKGILLRKLKRKKKPAAE